MTEGNLGSPEDCEPPWGVSGRMAARGLKTIKEAGPHPYPSIW